MFVVGQSSWVWTIFEFRLDLSWPIMGAEWPCRVWCSVELCSQEHTKALLATPGPGVPGQCPLSRAAFSSSIPPSFSPPIAEDGHRQPSEHSSAIFRASPVPNVAGQEVIQKMSS